MELSTRDRSLGIDSGPAEAKRIVNSPEQEFGPQTSDASDALSALRDAKYLNLESYRQGGSGVRTPVWFAAGSGDFPNSDIRKLYV